MTNFFNDLIAWFLKLFKDLIQWIYDFFVWLIDFFWYMLYQLIVKMLSVFLSALSSIPRPEIFTSAQEIFCNSFSDLGGIASGFNVSVPLGLIFSAYAVRFIIRRIPGVG